MAADAAFSRLAGDRIAVVPHVVPYQPGQARPLYVTAAGMPRADAADLVRQMAGRHRLPDALRRADTLARYATPSRAP